MENKNMTTYYKVKESHIDYKGKRFFKIKDNADSCVQVCTFPGEAKRGVSNNIGITSIHSLSFYSNYAGPNYVERCAKKEFDKFFNILIDVFKSA